MRTFIAIIRGWLCLLAFITGGNFVRQARIRKGRGVKISPTAFFKFPENIEIGDNSFINHLCSVWAAPNARIRIGRNVLFGPSVTIIASNHGIAAGQLIREQPGVDQDVTVGNDVWIGAHVTITPGVTIGDGCVVGAGAVVTSDLPSNAICVGVPARVVGHRKTAPVR